MVVNPTGRTEAIRALKEGDVMFWTSPFINLSTEMTHLQTSARRLGVKVACTKVLVVAEGEIPEAIIKVERIE